MGCDSKQGLVKRYLNNCGKSFEIIDDFSLLKTSSYPFSFVPLDLTIDVMLSLECPFLG